MLLIMVMKDVTAKLILTVLTIGTDDGNEGSDGRSCCTVARYVANVNRKVW